MVKENNRTVNDCTIINLPKITDPRGNLSIIEQIKQIPFEIKRVHWVYDVPGGYDRGGHAYKETEEFIVALSGSFDVVVDDGEKQRNFPLNDYGEYKAWRKKLRDYIVETKLGIW